MCNNFSCRPNYLENKMAVTLSGIRVRDGNVNKSRSWNKAIGQVHSSAAGAAKL